MFLLGGVKLEYTGGIARDLNDIVPKGFIHKTRTSTRSFYEISSKQSVSFVNSHLISSHFLRYPFNNRGG